MDREGLVSVRNSTGEWFFLQTGPNSRAFTLEGEFGEKYLLQTDKEVRSLLNADFAAADAACFQVCKNRYPALMEPSNVSCRLQA